MSSAGEPPVVGDTSDQYEGAENAADVVLAISCALLLGLVIRTVNSLLPRKWQKNTLPFTASVLITGLVVGIVLIYGGSSDDVSSGLRQLEKISPVVLFAVFMPALITPSGLTLDFHEVKHTVVYWFSLAIFGTMINATLITMVARYVFPYSWSWSQSWLLGAILAATDPVSVISIMEANACDEKLKTVVNGESLVNDGVAYCMFEVFLGWAEGEAVLAGDVVKFVFKAALGGPALGVGFALAVTLWFELLDSDAISVISLSLAAAYALWTLSDVVLGVSAVLAVLFFSGFVGLYGKTHIRGAAQAAFSSFWEWVDWIANTLIFFVGGLIIASEVSNNASDPLRYKISGKDWGMMFSLYFLLIPIRVVSIAILSPILLTGRYRMSIKDLVVLSWSGLRGAVGLTLSLIVYNGDIEDKQYTTLVFFFVGGAAVLSLLIQGTTTGLLLEKLGYTTVSPAKQHLQLQSAELVDQVGIACIERAKERAAAAGFVMGEPDWEQCKKLSNIDVASMIKERFAEKGDDTALKYSLTVHEKELLENLRERLLRAVQSHYELCARQGYLTPAEISILTSSIENASDALDEPLDDWGYLEKELDLSCLQEETTGWRGATMKILAKTRKFIVQQRGPLSSLARRNPALILTCMFAHAEAQRQLQLWVELEADADDLDDGVGFSTDKPRQHSFNESLDKLHKYQPYWDADELRDLGALARETHAQRHPTKHSMRNSLVHHLTSNSLMLAEDVKKVLAIVCDESTLQIQRANDVFDAIKATQPEEVQNVATELLTIDVLLKQAKMIKFFVDLGLLEGSEVDACLDVIALRQRGLTGDVNTTS